MKSSNIQRTVMRRVYYSYGLAIVTHIVFWQGVFLGASALLLAQWLHVSSIINNFLSTPVGNVPQYVVGSFQGAIMDGQLLTALLLVLAGGVALSAGYQLAQALVPRIWHGVRL